jgi:hypothetical protein
VVIEAVLVVEKPAGRVQGGEFALGQEDGRNGRIGGEPPPAFQDGEVPVQFLLGQFLPPCPPGVLPGIGPVAVTIAYPPP